MRRTYVLKQLGTFYGRAILHTDDDRTWHIDGLVVLREYRGRKYGTAILNRIICDADREGKILKLVADPLGHPPTLTAYQLRSFYRRHGFQSNAGYLNYMTRRPVSR